MPVATYNLTGTVYAIQWTGSNLADIQAALPSFEIFTSPSSTGIGISQPGAESYELSGHWVDQGSWLVSLPYYGTGTQEPLSYGFSIVDNTTFTQQYAAA